MRIWFGIIICIGLVGYSGFSVSATGFELDKAELGEEWNEGEANQSILRINNSGSWDDLHLKLSGKFYVVPVEDHFSSLNARFVLPNITEDFDMKVGYDWDDDYQIYSAGMNYNFKPFSKTTLDLGFKMEERQPEFDRGCPYRFNNETLAFSWEKQPWEYRVKLARNDKEYYRKDPQYTCLKYELEEDIGWQLRPNVEIQLEYHEDSGKYPAANSTDFWKQEWVIQGKHNIDKKWQYDWEYSKLYWERGYEPYRDNQKIQFRAHTKLNPAISLVGGWVCRDLHYYSAEQDYSEPGVYFHPETDLKSRVENKLSLELQFKNSPYVWELGSFIGDFHYKSNPTNDKTRSGIYGSFLWKFKQMELSVKAAPAGDLSTSDAYYQLKIIYIP
ncbi:MAG TPA: hypothetical protein DDW65_15085 [Firmicutes bacterium]|jgi:hypothetical protein|nr:hypothetical protein [Bacillota bacterium]